MIRTSVDTSGRHRGTRDPRRAAEPHFCAFLWSTITIHCDGNVTCGLDDPHAMRSFGNVKDSSIRDIWANARYEELRNNLLAGRLCDGCHLYTPVSDHGLIHTPNSGETPRGERTPVGDPSFPYPTRLIIEPTIACNLRCNQTVCNVNYAPGATPRAESTMSLETFTRVMDELGPHLTYMYFFNYGDPFMNPRAEEMLAVARARNATMEIVTSTNGLPLAKESRARALVQAAPDRIVFTIGGARQESYERYHLRGKLELALRGMANVCRAKRELGADRPVVSWRYLTFHWNDSDHEIDLAEDLARQIGVDELRFHLTREPAGAASRIRAPGLPGHERIKANVDYAFGYHFAMPFPDGFYQWEHVPGLGSLRWSGHTATLPVPEDRPWVALGFAVVVPPGGQTPVVTLTGPFGVRTVTPGVDRWHVVYLPLHREASDGSAAEIRLEVDTTWRPFDVGFNDDERELGVMVSTAFGPDGDGVGVRPDGPDRNGCYPELGGGGSTVRRWLAPMAGLSLRPRNGVVGLALSVPRAERRDGTMVTVASPWGVVQVPVGGRRRSVRLEMPDGWGDSPVPLDIVCSNAMPSSEGLDRGVLVRYPRVHEP